MRLHLEHDHRQSVLTNLLKLGKTSGAEHHLNNKNKKKKMKNKKKKKNKNKKKNMKNKN